MKETLKRIIKKIPIPLTKNHKYDLLTTRIIKKTCQEHSNCIDVGCHTGEILDTILKYAPKGQQYCFEPLPHLYDGLVKKYTQDNCHFYKVALSDETGTATFNYVVSSPAYSGFRPREYGRPTEEEQKITVQTELLDNIIPKDVKIDLIKIDVEGAEMQVFKGAKETIKRNKPILVFEHGMGAADYYGTRPEEVYDFLVTACGLNISLLDSYAKKGTPLTKAELVRQFEERINYYFIAHP